MATIFDVLEKANALCAALQDLIEDGRFDGYRDFLEGEQEGVVASRESFSNRHPDGSQASSPQAASALDAATGKARSASPSDASMAQLETACEQAIEELDAA